MSDEWSLPAWAVLVTLGAIVVVLAIVLLAAVTAVRRAAARAEESSAAAHALSEDLRAQVSAIEARLTARPSTHEAAVDEREYLITRLGDSGGASDGSGPSAAPVVDGPLFADLVLRESLVQAASFAAGLRRALDPAHLNQVRFEMRRELKRARKQRRSDLRRARREFEARDRDPDVDGEAAA